MTEMQERRKFLRASETDFDVTVTVGRRAHGNQKSSVPRREKVPREARPKNLRTKKRGGAARSAAENFGGKSGALSRGIPKLTPSSLNDGSWLTSCKGLWRQNLMRKTKKEE